MLERTARRAAGRLTRQATVLGVVLVVGAIILAVTGYDAPAVYGTMAQEAAGSAFGLAGSLRWATPLILMGLSVAISFRAGLFNIGGQGQFYLGAITSTAVALNLPAAPDAVVVAMAVFVGGVAGALWSAIAGVLRAFVGTNELVVTLMLNFIAAYLTFYLARVPLHDPAGSGQAVASAPIPAGRSLSELMPGSGLTMALFIALVAVVLVALYVRKSSVGYEAKVLGANPYFAQSAGLSVPRIIITTFVLSGFVAGVAGAAEVLGPLDRFIGNVDPDIGLDGVVVALMGFNTPVGTLLAALLFGGLEHAAQNAELLTDVPRAMVTLLVGVFTLLVTAAVFWPSSWQVPAIHSWRRVIRWGR